VCPAQALNMDPFVLVADLDRCAVVAGFHQSAKEDGFVCYRDRAKYGMMLFEEAMSEQDIQSPKRGVMFLQVMKKEYAARVFGGKNAQETSNKRQG